MEVSRGFVGHLAFILSHHSAKFGVHRPYETGNNGVCNIFPIPVPIPIPMPRFQCRGSQWSANLIGLFELELAPSEILLTAGNDQL